MGHDAPSSPGRFAVALAVVAIVAATLNLTFAHMFHAEPLGLLGFGLFCIGYSLTPPVFRRRIRERTADSAVKEGLPSGLTGRKKHPVLIRDERNAETKSSSWGPRPYHALTIDLEDYFHTEVASQGVSFEDWERQPPRIEASTHRLLDLLDRNQTRATFFVLGWVAKRHPHLVREIHIRGHEIGCHSLNHQLISRMNPSEFYENTRIAKNLIESIVREPVLGYRAPCFSIAPTCEWAFDVLSHLGFEYDSSIHPVHHPVYGNSNAPRGAYRVGHDRILELPIATWKVAGRNLPVGGGAYLRLLPYQYIHRGLAAWEKEMAIPAMLYLHPWEIDPYQPYIPLSFPSRIRQTWGTATMEEKLQRLLGHFRFAPAREVYKDLLELEPVKSSKSAEFLPEAAVAQVAG